MTKFFSQEAEVEGNCSACPNCTYKAQQGGAVRDDPEYEYVCKKGQSIVTQDRLRFLRGKFPSIPKWCPLPDVKPPSVKEMFEYLDEIHVVEIVTDDGMRFDVDPDGNGFRNWLEEHITATREDEAKKRDTVSPKPKVESPARTCPCGYVMSGKFHQCPSCGATVL